MHPSISFIFAAAPTPFPSFLAVGRELLPGDALILDPAALWKAASEGTETCMSALEHWRGWKA